MRAAGLIGQDRQLDRATGARPSRPRPGIPAACGGVKELGPLDPGGIHAGNAGPAGFGIAAYTSASGLPALTDPANPHISRPLYAPSRIGANRNVYIVLNIAEDTLCKVELAGTGTTPVGWEFAKGESAQRNMHMVGFGATRFAAMEFCKTLRQQAAAAAGGAVPWNSAWIIDDNVVAVGNFAGFNAVELVLGANACAGFHGGTVAEAPAANRAWALAQIAAGHGQAPAALPAPVAAGIVQQIALWNINYFDVNHLDFGPSFITSAEDLSIANYFNNAGIPYQFYNGINVVKEDPTYDNGGGATALNKNRQDLARWITAAEGATPPAGGAATADPGAAHQPRRRRRADPGQLHHHAGAAECAGGGGAGQ